MKKRFFYSLIIILMSFTFLFYGCSASESHTNIPRIKIGVTLYRQEDTFIASIINSMQDIAKKREFDDGVKITLNIMDGKGNQSIQNDQVDKFLSQGYDVICVNEVDRTAAAVIIDKAKAAQIPVVFFNREPVEEDMQRWDKLYYVGSNPTEGGNLQGKIVADLFEKDPERVDRNGDDRLQYIMLEGEPGHQDAAIRTEYSIKTLRKSGISVEKLANDAANWQRAQASTKMAQWILEFGDSIEVVFSNNDDMALGAIDAYTAAGINKLPVIVGLDATIPALEALKNGTLSGTVKNNASTQAQAIFDLAYALAVGEDLKEAVPLLKGQYVMVPQKILTGENVDMELSSETSR